jgi:hypothetical protein
MPNDNWTNIPRRSIISPVSTILLQENSFKPAFISGLFFVHRRPPWPRRVSPLRIQNLRYVMTASSGLSILSSSALHANDMHDGSQVCRSTAGAHQPDYCRAGVAVARKTYRRRTSILGLARSSERAFFAPDICTAFICVRSLMQDGKSCSMALTRKPFLL